MIVLESASLSVLLDSVTLPLYVLDSDLCRRPGTVPVFVARSIKSRHIIESEVSWTSESDPLRFWVVYRILRSERVVLRETLTQVPEFAIVLCGAALAAVRQKLCLLKINSMGYAFGDYKGCQLKDNRNSVMA